MKKVSVFGIGKAGLPLSAVIADSGFSVLGVGRDKYRVDRLNKGFNPILEEKELSKILKRNISKKLFFTTDGIRASKESQIHIIIVPLFIDKNNKPDFTNIIDVSEKIAQGLKKKDLVVVETTVPIGTTNGLIKKILEGKSGMVAGEDFYLACSPERIMTGVSISRYREFPKVVGGIDKKSARMAVNFYRKFCKEVIGVNDLETAEMTKIAEGVYRDVNIALANELYKVSDKYGINFWEVRRSANHTYCHIHEPGSVGGHCIPVYPWFLINSQDVPLIKAARLLNDLMINYYAEKVKRLVKRGNDVLVIGLSFRAGVKETAYSRSIPLVKLLEEKGYQVSIYDPLYSKEEIEKFNIRYSNNFNKADCIILMNKYPLLKKKLLKFKKRIIDIKNSLEL